MGLFDLLGLGDLEPQRDVAKHGDTKPQAVSPDAVHAHDDLRTDRAADPTAMLDYIDFDHQDPALFSPTTNAAVMQVLATTAKMGEIAKEQTAIAEQQRIFREKADELHATGVAAQLVYLSQNMNAANSKRFLQTLDSIDDSDVREQVMRRFAQQNNGTSLADFIVHSNDWNNNGTKRDKEAALQLIDSDRDEANDAIRAMSPEDRATKEAEAQAYAQQILSATTKHDQGTENQQKIFEALQGRDAIEIEMIRTAVRRNTNGESNLYQAIDNGMEGRNQDEAIAMLAGDRVASARAVFDNERDPARWRSVLKGLKPEERQRLHKEQLLEKVMNPSDRAEMLALLDDNTALADAERLGNILKDQKEGYSWIKNQAAFDASPVAQDNYKRRDEKNVLKEFESMSGEQVRAAADAWNKAHPDKTFEAMLDERWGNRPLSGKVDKLEPEYLRLFTMIKGDKAANRSVRMTFGMKDHDQAMIEGALAHGAATPEQLKENALFEKYNAMSGKSTKQQLDAYYKDRAPSGALAGVSGFLLGGNAGDMIATHEQGKNEHDRIAANELLATGTFTPETQIHRGKSAKDTADILDGLTTRKAIEDVQAAYKAKYRHELLPAKTKDRSDMSADELRMNNILLYGPRASRPAQLEYMLQAQQYTLQKSEWLEANETDEAGGGTQQWQRQELDAMRSHLKEPTIQIHDPVMVERFGYHMVVDGSPSFDQIQKRLPTRDDAKTMSDGLANGASKREFNLLDQGMTTANEAQRDAKKQLADRIVEVFGYISKLTLLIPMAWWLEPIVELGQEALEMLLKEQAMGEAYDPSIDARALMFTAAAKSAMLTLSKGYGKEFAGDAAETAISTVGGGIAQEKSAGDIARGAIVGGVGLGLNVVTKNDAWKNAVEAGNKGAIAKELARDAAIKMAKSTGLAVAKGGDEKDAVIGALAGLGVGATKKGVDYIDEQANDQIEWRKKAEAARAAHVVD